jgi:Skp family chaperone for outer membrane proteins
MRYALISTFALLLAAGVSFGQTKIAVVNPAKILQEMKETKESNEGFKAEQTAVQNQFKERQEQLAALERQKNELKPDAPQWAELNRKVVTMRTENEVWLKEKDQELTMKFRAQAKSISGKIRTAIEEVAKAKGYELVVSKQSELQDAEMERIPLPQLMPALLAKTVFYSADSIDITQDVLAKLDASYSAAAPAPAAN